MYTMKFKVTSPFGALEEFRDTPHTGIDLAYPQGTPILSPTDGVIEKIVNYGDENIGKGIFLRTEDGESLIFGHLEDWKVKVGEIIEKGDILGLSGNTGNSTGPHLHIGLKENGMFVDPSKYIDSPIKEFILQKFGPLTDFFTSLMGFNFHLNELFFLLPACVLFLSWLFTKVGGRWVVPLLYSYTITEVLQ